MKLRILPVLAMLVILLLPAACSSKRPDGQLIIGSCDAFDNQPHAIQDINITAGGSFAVILCSNPTTGFQWAKSAQISDETVVQQTNHKFMSPENTGMEGAPGNEIWTFKVLRKGISTITFEYSQPWEGGEKNMWTLDLLVFVE